jgi:hypothetical protein
VFVPKPFTDYTAADYALLTGVNLGGFFWLTQRVIAVSPGIIQTPVYPADSYEGLRDQLPPLGRVGQVSDVVAGVLFLESSPFVTGEILHIDGGQTAGH